MKKVVIGMLGLSLIAAAPVAVFAADGGEYNSNGTVDFMPNPDPTLPVDPTNPDPDNPVSPVDPTDPEGPQPGTKGPLSIDYVSSFDFGLNKISNKNETYYARAQTYTAVDGNASALVTPNYVQVSDNRGNNAGWTLKVKQNGQFTNETTLNKTLTGSEIKLTNPVVKSNAEGVVAPVATAVIALDPAGAEAVVFSAQKDAGAGTWVEAWGSAVEEVTEKDKDNNDVQATINKEVSLFVPGKTPKDAVKYATTLTWTLSDVPGNA